MKAIIGSSPFKQKFSLQQRIKMSWKIRQSTAQLTPVVIERCSGLLWGQEKKYEKYAITSYFKISLLVEYVKKQWNVSSTKSIALTVKNKILNQQESVKELYDKYKDDDGFLYISVTYVETF